MKVVVYWSVFSYTGQWSPVSVSGLLYRLVFTDMVFTDMVFTDMNLTDMFFTDMIFTVGFPNYLIP